MCKSILNSYTPRDESYFQKETLRAKRRLIVHVEDRPDVIFWRKILAPYEDSLDINFVPAHSQWSEKRQQTVSANGKSMIMSLIKKGGLSLSSDEIACVDADYDLLIGDTYSNILSQQTFVFTTEWYSIENIKCHPHNLRTMSINLLEGDDCEFDFKRWIEEKAKSYARLFLLNLTCRQYSQPEEYALETMSDDIAKIEDKQKSIEDVVEEHKDFLSPMQDAITDLENDLRAKGYAPEDYYKIIQGHMLVNQIVVPFLETLLHDEYSKRHIDFQNISADIKTFFKREYSVEYLDITDKIRNKMVSTLKL